MSPANLGVVGPALLFQGLLSSFPLSPLPNLEQQFEFFPETPLGTQTAQEIANSLPYIFDPSSLPPQVAQVDDRERFCVVWSASTSLPPQIPPPQAATLPSPNWHKIPQKTYDHGQKQWDFIPSECISFGVNGCPGVNVVDALHKRFNGLDGRDDPVLQGASSAISCRLSVRLT